MRRAALGRGERIHTENSYKYRPEEYVAMLAAAGFPAARTWTDERGWFAVILAFASAPDAPA